MHRRVYTATTIKRHFASELNEQEKTNAIGGTAGSESYGSRTSGGGGERAPPGGIEENRESATGAEGEMDRMLQQAKGLLWFNSEVHVMSAREGGARCCMLTALSFMNVATTYRVCSYSRSLHSCFLIRAASAVNSGVAHARTTAASNPRLCHNSCSGQQRRSSPCMRISVVLKAMPSLLRYCVCVGRVEVH